MSKTADILFFGAHPDDVEIGVGGIVAKHAANGYSVAICHLTDAELSSNGTVEARQQEAKEAANILGVTHSIRLGFPDRELTGSKEQLLKITQIIRQFRPRVILAPYWHDRHPDHVACSKMVKEAMFDAGIQKRETPGGEPAHRVKQIYYYYINNVDKADVIVDVSDVYEKKSKALLAYNSQFSSGKGQVRTPLNQPTYLAMIRGRDQLWGHQIGALYGEGLASASPIKKDLLV